MKDEPSTPLLTINLVRVGEEALGGLAAGVVGTVLGYPLDLIKTRLQTGTASGGVLKVASQIVRAEGVLSLYKGIGPPLVSLSIVNTTSFASYAHFRQVYGGRNGWDARNALAGMTGCPAFSIVTTPENFLKTQMQMDNVHDRRFRSSLHCARVLMSERGWSVLYTGHGVNTIREAAFVGCYFFVYEGFRENLTRNLGTHAGVPLAGGLAGASAWFFSFPLDCVRAGVQGRNLADPIRRGGAFRVLSDLISAKGLRGLYAGVGPSIARAFLVSGSRFSAYEGALWLCRGGRDEISPHDSGIIPE